MAASSSHCPAAWLPLGFALAGAGSYAIHHGTFGLPGLNPVLAQTAVLLLALAVAPGDRLTRRRLALAALALAGAHGLLAAVTHRPMAWLAAHAVALWLGAAALVLLAGLARATVRGAWHLPFPHCPELALLLVVGHVAGHDAGTWWAWLTHPGGWLPLSLVTVGVAAVALGARTAELVAAQRARYRPAC